MGVSIPYVVLQHKDDVKENVSFSPVSPFKLFRGFGKLKFVCFKIILAFGVPALDTIMGKEKL